MLGAGLGGRWVPLRGRVPRGLCWQRERGHCTPGSSPAPRVSLPLPMAGFAPFPALIFKAGAQAPS